MLIGILYGLYNAKTRALAVLAAVGAVLTVLLVTRVQNMDDHQSLAVAPFYLLGCFLCALLVSNLPWAWPRRTSGNSGGVLCALLDVVQSAAAGGFPQRILQRTVLLRGQPPQ